MTDLYPLEFVDGDTSPANTRPSNNGGTMLRQRRRRWANIVPILVERIKFAKKKQLQLYVSKNSTNILILHKWYYIICFN